MHNSTKRYPNDTPGDPRVKLFPDFEGDEFDTPDHFWDLEEEDYNTLTPGPVRRIDPPPISALPISAISSRARFCIFGRLANRKQGRGSLL